MDITEDKNNTMTAKTDGNHISRSIYNELIRNLIICNTDVDSALRRFLGNEELYFDCLRLFAEDNTMAQLEEAIKTGNRDVAVIAASTVLGLSGNMGFIPLYHASLELAALLSKRDTENIYDALQEVLKNYWQIISVINSFCGQRKR